MEVEIDIGAGLDTFMLDVDSVADFFSVGMLNSNKKLFGQDACVSYDMKETQSGFAVITYLSSGHLSVKHKGRYGMTKDKAIVYMVKSARACEVDIQHLVKKLFNSNKKILS